MTKLSPLFKGLITGVAMVVTTILMLVTKQNADGPSAYIIYGLYALGVIWTLYDYARAESYQHKFGAIFGQGFRCFIIITLVMVIFTGIYSKANPQMGKQSAEMYRQDLVKKKNMLPADIDKNVAQYQDNFTASLVSTAIFGYLVVGVFFTAAGAAFLLIRRKN